MMNWRINVREIKRYLAAFLAFVMMVTIIPNQTFIALANQEEGGNGSVSDNTPEDDPILPVLTFEKESLELAYGTTGSNVASSGEGVVISYWVDQEDVEIVSVDQSGQVTPMKVGEATVWAGADSDGDGTNEVTKSYEVNVVKGVQTALTWEKGAESAFCVPWTTNTFSNVASNTTETGNEVVYSVDSNSSEPFATIDEATGVVTLLKPGTVSVTATKAGGENYNNTTASYTLTIEKVEQDILEWTVETETPGSYNETWDETKLNNEGKFEFVNTIKEKEPNTQVSYAITSTDLEEDEVEVDAATGVVILEKPGMVVITATKTGGDFYNNATASYTLTVGKMNQETLEWTVEADAETPGRYSEPWDVSKLNAEGKYEFTNVIKEKEPNTQVSYAITATDLQAEEVSVDASGKVTMSKPGQVTITATKMGDDYYNEITASYVLTVGLADQMREWSVNEIPQNLSWKDTFTNEAISNIEDDKLPNEVRYEIKTVESELSTVENPVEASVDSNGEVSINMPGKVTVLATVAGNDYYAGTAIEYEVTFGKADLVLSFDEEQVSDKYWGETFTNAAEFGDDFTNIDANVKYEIASTSTEVDVNEIAEINSATGEVTTKKPGTVIITASKEGNAYYNDAESISYTLIIVKKPQEKPEWANEVPESLTWKETFTNPVKAIENDKREIKYFIDSVNTDPDLVTIDENGKVTAEGPCEVKVRARAVENEYYKDNKSIYYTLKFEKVSVNQLDMELAVMNPESQPWNEAFSNPLVDKDNGKTKVTYSIASATNSAEADVDKEGTVTVDRPCTVKVKVRVVTNEYYDGYRTVFYNITFDKADQEPLEWSNKEIKDGVSVPFNKPFINQVLGGNGTGDIVYEVPSDAGWNVSVNSQSGEVTMIQPDDAVVTITAYKKGDEKYNESEKITYSFKVGYGKLISFTNPEPQSVEINKTLENPVKESVKVGYKSSDDSIAWVDNKGTVHARGKAGTVTITATVADDDGYQGWKYEPATYELNVVWKTNPRPLTFDDKYTEKVVTYKEVSSFTNKATSSRTEIPGSRVEILYLSTNELVATVDNKGEVTIHAPGKTTIKAYIEPQNNYARQEVSYELIVNKREQKVLLDTSSKEIKFGEAFQREATPEEVLTDNNNNEELIEIEYISSNPEVATVDEAGNVTTLKAGIVTITAKAKESAYHKESETKAYKLTILPYFEQEEMEVTIHEENRYTCVTNTPKGLDGCRYANVSGNYYAVVNDEETGEVRLRNGGGSAVIKAYITTTDETGAEVKLSATYTLIVKKYVPEISFEKNAYELNFGDAFEEGAVPKATLRSIYPSNAPAITYSVSNDPQNIVEVVDGTYTLTGNAGSATLLATLEVNRSTIYETVTAECTLTVKHVGQTVEFENGTQAVNITYGETHQNKATATTPVSYRSSDETIATVDANGIVTPLKAGEVTITAIAEEKEQYAEASASYTITIEKAERTVWFTDESKEVTYKENLIIPNPVNWKGVMEEQESEEAFLQYSLASNNVDVAVIDSNDNVVKAVRAGEAVITVTVGETERYKEATATYTLKINKASQYISFSEPEYTYFVGQQFEEHTVPTASMEVGTEYGDGDIIYEVVSDPNGIVKDFNGTSKFELNPVAGDVVIKATKAACDRYEEATAEYTLHYELNKLTVTLENVEGKNAIIYGEDFTLQAKVNYITQTNTWGKDAPSEEVKQKAEPLIYSSSDPAIASIDERTGKVTFNDIGQVVLSANVEGNAYFEGAGAFVVLNTIPTEQKITFKNGNDITITYNPFPNNSYQNIASTNDPSFDPNTEGARVYKLDTETIYDNVNPEDIVEVDSLTGEVTVKRSGKVRIGVTFKWSEFFKETTAYYTLQIEKANQQIKLPGLDEGYPCVVDSDGTITYRLTCGRDFESYKDQAGNALTDPKVMLEEGKNGTGAITYTIDEDDGEYEDVIKLLNNTTGDMEFTYYGGTAVVEVEIAECNCYNSASASYKIFVSALDGPTELPYELVGVKNNNTADDKWFAGNVSIKAKDGYMLSYEKYNDDNATWATELTDAVTAEGRAVKSFFVKDAEGNIYKKYSNVNIYKDSLAPSAKIWLQDVKNNDTLTDWSNHLTIIGNDKYKNGVKLCLSYVNGDENSRKPEISEFWKAEYYIVEGTTDVMNDTELDEISLNKWTEFTKNSKVEIKNDKAFVIYAKVMDKAGNYQYVSTNGIVYEKTAPIVEYTINGTTIEAGYYGSDVTIDIDVTETGVYSGIKEVGYRIEYVNNGETNVSQKDTRLYEYEEDEKYSNNPLYSDLRQKWSSDENGEKNKKSIKVDAAVNNYDEVYVIVWAIDNAGNIGYATYTNDYGEVLEKIPMSICIADPRIDVVYDDSDVIQNTVAGVNYYQEERKIDLVVTRRKRLFDMHNVIIKVIATDVNGKKLGNEVIENKDITNGLKTKYFTIDKWETNVGQVIDETTHTTTITFMGDAKYTCYFAYRNSDATLEITPDPFVIDKTAPGAEAVIATEDEKSTWSWNVKNTPDVIDFQRRLRQAVTLSAQVSEPISPIQSFDYYVANSKNKLDPATITEEMWQPYEQAVELGKKNAYFTVYFRVVDYANNTTYFNTNGYVVDYDSSTITLDIVEDAVNNYYSKDISVNVNVDETSAIYSGIDTIEYWVTCDGKKTQGEVLYDYNGNYTRDSLVKSWNTATNNKTITIDSAKNNSDNVVLVIKTTDNAGNTKELTQAFKIDSTEPLMSLEYTPKSGHYVDADKNRGYYGENRTAIITITERTSTFDEEAALQTILDSIMAHDYNNKKLDIDWDKTKMVWTHIEGEKPDDAKHIVRIVFEQDANYTIDALKLPYTNIAGKKSISLNVPKDVQNPFSFTVDKLAPKVEVTREGRTWSTLFDILTFQCGKKDVVVTVSKREDATSPYNIYYYVTDKTEPVSLTALMELPKDAWTEYKDKEEIKTAPNKYSVVYFKAVDYAGNVAYLNTDGYIVDKVASEISLTPDKTEIYHDGVGVYKGDVEVLVKVSEPSDYSGIAKVEYWVTCDDEETQRETLYDFAKEGPELKDGEYPSQKQLKQSFTKKVKVLSELNNSCNVVLNVQVKDNAGNVSTKQQKLDIDITAPTIQITYNNTNLKKKVNGREYYDKNRTATVVITERTEHFDPKLATDGIVITTKDIKDFKDTDIISGWTTVESQKGANAATHTAKITYAKDANYSFKMTYTDDAGNSNVKSDDVKGIMSPYLFTVDKKAPTGTLQVSNLGTWESLVTDLTFGLTSKVAVKVSGTSEDEISPIESVLYYKTSKESALSLSELEKITDWTNFTEFYVSPVEQFTVYKKLVDYAGNVAYISTNGVILDDRPANIVISTPNTDTGIYNSDVGVNIQVTDPTMASSGIKEITYQVYNMGAKTQEGVLYHFDKANPKHADLVSDVSSKIIVDSMSNNSNSVTITVNAIDNAGNTSTESKTIMIDITKPTISVSYDNNNGDTSFGEPTYFKENRTATITVVERNFNPGLVNLVITNSDGVIPTLSAWSSSNAGAGNGDGTTHTAYVVFAADGDYTLDVSCSDVVGNTNTDVNYSNSLAPQSFTVDKTLPVIEVSYDNNSAENGSYYKEERVATIRIREHNFETSRIQTEVKATEDGAAIQAPTISGWSSAGDVHTATIRYTENALYKFNISYIDKAGNTAATFAEQSFYVDKTAPEISISGIVNESANNATGNIGFVITATDVNFDQFVPVVEVTYMDGETIKTKQVTDEVGSFTDVENGKVYTVTNLSTDGIYTIKCTVVDKAGNAFTEVSLQDKNGSMSKKEATGEDELVLFSVNRNGSTYDLSDATKELINNYYVKILKNDLVIEEVNSDELKEYSITLNGNTLTEGKDYTVSVEGSRGQWMKYTYTIRKDLFDKEGEYRVVVSSKDKAGNNAYNDVKGANINFVVDRTAPVVTVTGLSKNGRYQVEKQTVTIMPSDDGGALKSVLVQLVDDDGKSVRELINLSGADLEKALTDGAGKLSFEIEEGLYQNVEILCEDYAIGDAGSNANAYAEVFSNVSVSTSKIKIWWANKTLRYGVMGGFGALVAAIFFIILFKRRKDQEETN